VEGNLLCVTATAATSAATVAVGQLIKQTKLAFSSTFTFLYINVYITVNSRCKKPWMATIKLVHFIQ